MHGVQGCVLTPTKAEAGRRGPALCSPAWPSFLPTTQRCLLLFPPGVLITACVNSFYCLVIKPQRTSNRGSALAKAELVCCVAGEAWRTATEMHQK